MTTEQNSKKKWIETGFPNFFKTIGRQLNLEQIKHSWTDFKNMPANLTEALHKLMAVKRPSEPIKLPQEKAKNWASFVLKLGLFKHKPTITKKPADTTPKPSGPKFRE